MHFCVCQVRLNGDMLNVVPRGEFNPVSWPEVEVLRFLHGNESVIDVKAFVKVTQSAKDEKERLRNIYGSPVIEEVFPGRNPQMELDMPGAKLPDQAVLWQSPIDIDPASQGVIDPLAKAPAKSTKSPSPFA